LEGLPFLTICFLAGLAFISSSDKKILSVGIASELIRSDVFFWGTLMGGAILASIPVVLILYPVYEILCLRSYSRSDEILKEMLPFIVASVPILLLITQVPKTVMFLPMLFNLHI
jgi:hypothetical protein